MVNWDEKYAGTRYAYGTAPNDFLREQVGELAPGPVLVLADGEGRNGVFLAERGFAVTSVDRSPVGVAKAHALAAARGVTVNAIVADLAEWPFPVAAYNAVVSIFCHLPPTLRETVHRQAVAALRPGGRLLLEAYGKRQVTFGTGGPSDPALLLSTAELAKDFAGLRELHLAEREREVVEGHLHTGRAQVVQFLGEKPPNGDVSPTAQTLL